MRSTAPGASRRSPPRPSCRCSSMRLRAGSRTATRCPPTGPTSATSTTASSPAGCGTSVSCSPRATCPRAPRSPWITATCSHPGRKKISSIRPPARKSSACPGPTVSPPVPVPSPACWPAPPSDTAMFDIPTLETARLRLTALSASHFDDYAAMLADPASTRWVGDGEPLDRGHAWRSLAMLLGHWQLRGYGMWALELKDSGVFAGRAGLMYPEGWPDIELGWMLKDSGVFAGRAGLMYPE